MSECHKKYSGALKNVTPVNAKGVTFGNAMGHKRVLDLSSDTISVDAPIRNDVSSGVTIGKTPVSNTIHANGDVDSNKSIKNLPR